MQRLRHILQWLLLSGIVVIIFVGAVSTTLAQDEPLIVSEETEAVGTEQFYRGEVIEIVEAGSVSLGLPGAPSYTQVVRVRMEEGPQEDEMVTIEYSSLNEEHALVAGERVVVITPQDTSFVFDRYRLPALLGIGGLFAVLAGLFAGWRGLAALVGLALSVAIVAWYVVPRIMDGANPLMVSLTGAFAIAVTSIYLAHGFTKRTTIALVSTLITIVVAIGLSFLFVSMTRLTGMGSEEAFYLRTSPAAQINLRGLLLGGIIIGALGVLDDITTSQAAAVGEIWRANPRLTRRQLFQRGFVVGREHITSLINTLALAYIGSSLPALLLFTLYQRPWWVVANTETIAEEIIRTLVGSIALMCAVPITTWLAAVWLTRGGDDTGALVNDGHHHV